MLTGVELRLIMLNPDKIEIDREPIAPRKRAPPNTSKTKNGPRSRSRGYPLRSPNQMTLT